jgi:hypothetical protein
MQKYEGGSTRQLNDLRMIVYNLLIFEIASEALIQITVSCIQITDIT